MVTLWPLCVSQTCYVPLHLSPWWSSFFPIHTIPFSGYPTSRSLKLHATSNHQLPHGPHAYLSIRPRFDFPPIRWLTRVGTYKCSRTHCMSGLISGYISNSKQLWFLTREKEREMVRRASAWRSERRAGENSKLNGIMVRLFRPIAPKPDFIGSVSGLGNSALYGKRSGGKRRYVRVKKKTETRAVSEERDREMVTLSLLPEVPDRRETPQRDQMVAATQASCSCNVSSNQMMVGSCVTVECLMDACVDVLGLGSTDIEKRMNLGKDTCPGFVSDGCNKVRWTNEAYRIMVGCPDNGWPEMVMLEMKERLPLLYPAFACRVRLEYVWKKERKCAVVPCDVWRMGGGDLAWRLDMKAALSLGR